MWVAFSVDLEPNKDGSLDGIRDAMEWFDDTVPRGTVYATYRIARELPDVLERLAEDHEIGVHVHPQEFGHERDQLAELSSTRQRELIRTTRHALADAASITPEGITAFRAGRHSAGRDTFAALSELGFAIDASVNVRYTDYLPKSMTSRTEPFSLDNGLVELPTTYYRPPLLSAVGVCASPHRTVTATANTLRTDSWICSGDRSIRGLFAAVDSGVSMYMHPYDATTYHDSLENNGPEFRRRVTELLGDGTKFVTASAVVKSQ